MVSPGPELESIGPPGAFFVEFNISRCIKTVKCFVLFELMSIINAHYESEIVSMHVHLMTHAHIFWIPPCKEVIIQITLMLLCIAYTASDFHNAGKRPTRFPGRPGDWHCLVKWDPEYISNLLMTVPFNVRFRKHRIRCWWIKKISPLILEELMEEFSFGKINESRIIFIIWNIFTGLISVDIN